MPGGEVAGVVERGAGGFEEGQRVVAMVGTGGYAEYAAAHAATAFPIPDGVDDGVALALLIQGLTAWHLYRTSRQARSRASAWWCTRARAASATWPCSSRSRSARDG